VIELVGLAAYFAAIFIYGLLLLVNYDRIQRWAADWDNRSVAERILYHLFFPGCGPWNGPRRQVRTTQRHDVAGVKPPAFPREPRSHRKTPSWRGS
jgi:hypothetical protein